MRVQSIIRELRGEKIDIIPYNEETVAFAQKALSPAKVTRVQITDPENKKLEVIVEDSQLSLAIGKKGQNVRLASKLIGWDIDIKSEEEKRQEIEEQMTALTAPVTPLTSLAGVAARKRLPRRAKPPGAEKLQPRKTKLQLRLQPRLLPQRRQRLPRLPTQLRKIRRRRLQSPLQKLRPPPAKAMRSRRKRRSRSRERRA